MNGPMLAHRFMTGWYLWLVMAVVIGLAAGTQVATARDCRQETPLPPDVLLTPPGPEVWEAIASFAGA